MEKLLNIKGKVIGKGRPLVCVPVMEETRERIVEEVRRLTELHADMIEWRVDAFAEAESMNAIRDVLYEIQPLVKDSILVYTFRSKEQGGEMALEREQICDIHQVAAETKVADFIDLEYFASEKPRKEIRQLQAMGAHIIASHHDFDQTPERSVMKTLLEEIRESGADIVKLAVMPQSMQDVLNLMEETNYFHEEYPDTPLITMSMGKTGSITRVAGEYFGSCVTFGAGKKASAPGQFEMEELGDILQMLDKSLNG